MSGFVGLAASFGLLETRSLSEAIRPLGVWRVGAVVELRTVEHQSGAEGHSLEVAIGKDLGKVLKVAIDDGDTCKRSELLETANACVEWHGLSFSRVSRQLHLIMLATRMQR